MQLKALKRNQNVQQTSISAYIEEKLNFTDRCDEVLSKFMLNSGGHSVNEMIKIYWPNKPVAYIQPRVSELESKGLLYVSEKRKCAVTGKTVNVYRPTRLLYNKKGVKVKYNG